MKSKNKEFHSQQEVNNFTVECEKKYETKIDIEDEEEITRLAQLE